MRTINRPGRNFILVSVVIINAISLINLTYQAVNAEPQSRYQDQEVIELHTPPVNEDRDILANEIAKEELGIGVTPNPEPIPGPSPSPYKIGDDCPFCVGGWIAADGSVRVACWKCEGDGIINEGDPILSTQNNTEPTYYVPDNKAAFQALVDRVEKLEREVQLINSRLSFLDPGDDEEETVDAPPTKVSPPRKYRINVDGVYYLYKNDAQGERFEEPLSKAFFRYRSEDMPLEEATKVRICYPDPSQPDGKLCREYDIEDY